ncbi:response regulator [Petrachloros mirabilis]
MDSTIESHGSKKKTVLLVDDESAITLLYEVDLTRRGYTVMTAHSGTEATRISAEFQGLIDVLVTDWHMPDMSGDDLACDLLVQRPNLKVILMSGFPSAEAIAQAFPENQLVFLSKPFSPAKLDDTIRQLLGLLSSGERRVA